MTGFKMSVVLMIACMAYTALGGSITKRKHYRKEAIRDVLDNLQESTRGTKYPIVNGFVTVDGVGVKLVGGDGSSYGAVMVAHGGRTGWLCDNGFDLADRNNNNSANVVCRMMGFNQGTYEDGNHFASRGSAPYILTYVDCTGQEDSIADCWWNESRYCGDAQLAGVRCS